MTACFSTRGCVRRLFRDRPLLVIALLVVATGCVQQRDRPFRAQYTVEIKDTAAHLFHVTATFSNLRQR